MMDWHHSKSALTPVTHEVGQRRRGAALRTAAALSIMALLAARPAAAVTIVGDFSQLGTVYGNSIGDLTNTPGLVGYTDVTSAFEADFTAAATFWERALLIPFTFTSTVTLADLSSEQAVGDSVITSNYTGSGLPATQNLRVDDSTQAPTYVGTNPYDSTAFNLTYQTANLNGNTVNVARFGTAVPGGPADNQYDLLTLFLHELGHGLGFTDIGNGGLLPNSTSAACQAGETETYFTVSAALTGGTSFQVPFMCSDPSHIDGTIDGGLYNDATIAVPGFGENQRALITGLDILTLCQADGATADQCNADPSFAAPTTPTPEPATLLLLAGLFPVLAATRRNRA